jgi:hypothetical protein
MKRRFVALLAMARDRMCLARDGVASGNVNNLRAYR